MSKELSKAACCRPLHYIYIITTTPVWCVRSPICLRRDGCDGVMISVPPPISRFPGSGVSAGGTESPYLDTPPEKGRRALPLKRRDAENAFTGPSLPPPRRSSGWAPFRRVARAAPPGVRWGSVHRRPSPPPAGPGSSAVPAGSTPFLSETCDILRMEYYFLTTI